MAVAPARDIDPFTVEIVKDSLVAIGDEMFVALQRTSKSTIIYEVLDFASGLTDARGQLITQGNGVTGFLGTLTFAVSYTLEKFGADGLAPGDVIITNDPYTGGGTHLSDGPRSAARTPGRGRPTRRRSSRRVCSSRA
jgi:N-methylhydantoinase B